MGWGCEGISSASYTRSEAPTWSLSLCQLVQEQKIMRVNFLFFTRGWNGNSKKPFGAPGSTSTTSDMSSMAQSENYRPPGYYDGD